MKKTILISLFGLLIASGLFAQENKSVRYGATLTEKRQDAEMKKFRSNRFGQFIHWGIYSIPGGIWEGKMYPGASEFMIPSANIPISQWVALKDQFDPAKFNGKEWAKMAKNMGVRYATFTTKHHDGFCMWPTKYTDFNIANTPYKKDLVGEFVQAYNEAGIDVYLYYSILDWHHPDWRHKIESKEDSVAFERFKTFVKNQLVELVEKYPTVKGLWFDGTWDQSWSSNGIFSYELEQLLKSIRPGLIVNSRMRADEYGNRHFDANKRMMGDYESGYERRLPKNTDLIVTTRDWECCMTIPENQWGYHADWTVSHIKRPDELIEMMIKATSLGGNFLLNFGPKADGSFRKEETDMATALGKWMQENGEAIYNCDYAGLEKQDWGYYTRKTDSNLINLFVCNIPVSKRLKVELPAKVTIKSVKTKNNVKLQFEQVGRNTFEILLDKDHSSASTPFVIQMEIGNQENTGGEYIYFKPLV